VDSLHVLGCTDSRRSPASENASAMDRCRDLRAARDSVRAQIRLAWRGGRVYRLRGTARRACRNNNQTTNQSAVGGNMGSGKRILMLTHEFPPYPGGVGRYCWSLAAAASRAGHRVTVLAPAHRQLRSDQYRDPPGVEVTHFAGDIFHFRDL